MFVKHRKIPKEVAYRIVEDLTDTVERMLPNLPGRVEVDMITYPLHITMEPQDELMWHAINEARIRKLARAWDAMKRKRRPLSERIHYEFDHGRVMLPRTRGTTHAKTG